MSIEDGSSKEIPDLGISLNIHNRSIRLNNNNGAGVNATTSKVDITVVTSHPLSELVWCPCKGISIKKTNHDCTVAGKESASLWGLRPNQMTVSSAKSISTTLAGLENIVDDKNDALSLCPVNFGVDEVGRSIHFQDEGNATSVAICRQEGLSQQCNAPIAFVEQGGSRLNWPKAVADSSEKVEFSSENCIVAEASEGANPGALKFKGHLVDGRFCEEKYIRNQRKAVYLSKGKSKALSDGDVNDQISDDSMSHGSAGSCNSKMLVSSRNTKRSVDQQLMVTCKRLKQSTERDADSFIRQNSSFMSWISNMVKGYSRCNQDDSPSSMLPKMSTAHTEQENHSQKPVYHDVRGVGFRNLFQSICCSNDRLKERKIYFDNRSSEASGDVKHNSMVNISAVPLTVYKRSEIIPRDNGESGKMCDQRIGSSPKQCMNLSSNFSTKEIKILPGTKNTVSYNVANSVDIANCSQSISPTHKEGSQATEYSEEKDAEPFGPNKDYIGSLWISRFSPKISEPAAKFITSKLTVNKRVVHSSKIISSPGTVTSHSEGRNGFVKHEGLIGSEQVNLKDEQNLEVLASVFARRLDALKQVVPYDATFKPFSMASTCLFCGARGHEIQACSEITESELEELRHVIKSYDNFKDLTCLCIKCSQVSHWAIECPQRPSRKSVQGICRGNIKPVAESFQLQVSGKVNLDVADARKPLDHVSCTQDVGKSSSRPQNKMPASKEDVFDAVRRLRLSRSDFLRLVDLQISPSHLRGLYLRVRFSNLKGGLGQKGYYIACIQNTVTKRGALDQASPQTSVGVTIGSYNCLVESRYISNQDFVEDELMKWWTETTKYSYEQNPISLEELEEKYKERQRLGF